MKKYKSIIILLIIINIIFITLICNLVSGNVIKEKQIIKEMTQSELETSLNNTINQLNETQKLYAANVDAYKKKVTEAITNQGIPTEMNDSADVVAENIGKILNESTKGATINFSYICTSNITHTARGSTTINSNVYTVDSNRKGDNVIFYVYGYASGSGHSLASTMKLKIQGSEDNSTWEDIYTINYKKPAGSTQTVFNYMNKTLDYNYYRIQSTASDNCAANSMKLAMAYGQMVGL